MSRFFKGTWFLYSKELSDSFKAPLIYILTALFCALIGWLFFNHLLAAKDLSMVTLTQSIIIPIFGNMNFLFLIITPMLSMRMLAEERKLNTIELLFQSNLTHWQIILGKFCAGMTTILFMLCWTLIFPIVLSFSGYNDWGIVISSYGGLFFACMCYMAVGIFASSLTENQFIAAILSFTILMTTTLLIFTSNVTPNYLVGLMLRYISIPFHYEGLVRGAVKSYSLVYFVSFIGFFFYLTKSALDSRRW